MVGISDRPPRYLNLNPNIIMMICWMVIYSTRVDGATLVDAEGNLRVSAIAAARALVRKSGMGW